MRALSMILVLAGTIAGCSTSPPPPETPSAPALPGEAVPAVAAPLSVVVAHDPWVRASNPGASHTALFVTLHNPDAKALALIGARTEKAGHVEIHTHTEVDGVMQMRRIEQIAVPAGGDAVLRPGGDHLMLLDLPSPLVDGDQVAATLVFDDGSQIALVAPVRSVQSEAPAVHAPAGH